LDFFQVPGRKEVFQPLKEGLDFLGNIETDDSLWQDVCELGSELLPGEITLPRTDILVAA
jgi:hypothetical protein